jgi:predicted RNA-binding protein with PUA-like domain
MNYFLVKSEPGTYSYDDLVKDGKTIWDGVRNNAARLHLMAMKKGDQVLYYHTGEEKQVVGIARVSREAFPDPTDPTGKWIAVEIIPHKKFKKPVTLSRIKSDKRLRNMSLVRIGRLSVMPVTESEFKIICEMSAG